MTGQLTSELGERLRLAADDAGAYDVYDRSLRTARRRRIASWAAVIVAIALIVPLADLELGVRGTTTTPADGSTGPALPDRVGLPGYGSRELTDRPELGAAMVLFYGMGSRFGGFPHGSEDGGSEVALVGTGNEYRIGRLRGALLSPDGRTVAYAGDSGEGLLLDLTAGTVRRGPDGEPLAWSPDGRDLLLVHGTSLVLAAVGGSETRWLGTVPANDSVSRDQLSAAFTPDGSRLVFVLDHQVHVVDRSGRELLVFAPPDGYRLAGKGSWTPDGGAFALVNTADQAWRPRWFDGYTGAELPGPQLPDVPAGQVVEGDELIGWQPDGSALVVGPVEGGLRRLLGLAPGAAQPVTVMVLPAEVTRLDLADAAIATGRVRHAGTPFIIGPVLAEWLLVIALLVAAAGWAYHRYRARVRRAGLAAVPWRTINGEIR